jgi:hypothetical protein
VGEIWLVYPNGFWECIITGFQVHVLAKLDTIIENQQEQLQLLRHMSSAGSFANDSGEDVVIPTRTRTMQDFLDFNDKLSDADFLKNLVSVVQILCYVIHALKMKLSAKNKRSNNVVNVEAVVRSAII